MNKKRLNKRRTSSDVDGSDSQPLRLVWYTTGSVDCNTYPKQARGASVLFGFVCLSLRKQRGESGRSEWAAAVSTDAHEKHSYSHVPLHLFIFWQFSPLARKICIVFILTSQLAIISHLLLRVCLQVDIGDDLTNWVHFQFARVCLFVLQRYMCICW